jgi:hypothetical protein
MPTTTLDDLKNAWNELSNKLERQNTLALHQLKENRLAHLRFGLRPLVLGQVAQLVIGITIAAFFGWFWFNHLAALPLLICGVLLQAYGIMFIAFAVRDLCLIRAIDYAAPVVQIQKQLAQLRAWHIRTGIWFGLAGSIVWLPAMLIALFGLKADLWLDKPQKVWWLILSALVCLALNYGLLLLARSPGKCGSALRRSWIGNTVNRAQSMLDEIEQFERELN